MSNRSFASPHFLVAGLATSCSRAANLISNGHFFKTAYSRLLRLCSQTVKLWALFCSMPIPSSISGIIYFNIPVSLISSIPSFAPSLIIVFTNSSLILSWAISFKCALCFLIDFFVSDSIVKSSSEAILTARKMRNASSLKRLSGSPYRLYYLLFQIFLSAKKVN